METEIKALAYEGGVACRVHARPGLEDLMGELGPERTWSLLADTWPNVFEPRAVEGQAGEPREGVAPRLPQMCPGCGHRSAFHAVKAALKAFDEPITVADIGCHSLGFLPPYEMGEILLSMGHSVPTGAGLSLGNASRKVVAFLGDATLFHAGLPGIVNSIVYDHDVTLVVLDNATTAMTGHQARFGSGEVGPKIGLVQLFEALGVGFLREIDAYQQDKLIETLKEAMAHKGFAVVIAKHPCMLKFTRERLKKMPDFKMPQVEVDPVKCDRIHTCVRDFGCPSFVRHDDGSVTVHSDLCIGDGSCLQVCPVAALQQPRAGGKK
jgi:indolepyruvate ferredoxin oxidoreductase alpha subunit